MFRQAQDMHAFGFGKLGILVGKDVKLATACLNFLEIGFQFVDQLIEILGIGESNVSTKIGRLKQRIRDEL